MSPKLSLANTTSTTSPAIDAALTASIFAMPDGIGNGTADPPSLPEQATRRTVHRNAVRLCLPNFMGLSSWRDQAL
jgi:hypothetical protein